MLTRSCWFNNLKRGKVLTCTDCNYTMNSGKVVFYIEIFSVDEDFLINDISSISERGSSQQTSAGKDHQMKYIL